MTKPTGGSGCLPVVGVLAVVGFVVAGGLVAGVAALDPPVRLAGAEVSPVLGWVVVDRPPEGMRSVTLTTGAATLRVSVRPWTDGPESLGFAYADATLDPAVRHLIVGEPETDDTGVVRLPYTGVVRAGSGPVEGELVVLVARGTGVVFDAWAEEGTYAAVRDDVELMVDGAEVRG